MNKLLFNFLLGGILFSGIYYASNYMRNTALAAIIGLLPFSLICSYIIPNELISNYCYDLLRVIVITTLSIILLIICLNHININKNIIISGILIFWIILNYINYKL